MAGQRAYKRHAFTAMLLAGALLAGADAQACVNVTITPSLWELTLSCPELSTMNRILDSAPGWIGSYSKWLIVCRGSACATAERTLFLPSNEAWERYTNDTGVRLFNHGGRLKALAAFSRLSDMLRGHVLDAVVRPRDVPLGRVGKAYDTMRNGTQVTLKRAAGGAMTLFGALNSASVVSGPIAFPDPEPMVAYVIDEVCARVPGEASATACVTASKLRFTVAWATSSTVGNEPPTVMVQGPYGRISSPTNPTNSQNRTDGAFYETPTIDNAGSSPPTRGLVNIYWPSNVAQEPPPGRYTVCGVVPSSSGTSVTFQGVAVGASNGLSFSTTLSPVTANYQDRQSYHLGQDDFYVACDESSPGYLGYVDWCPPGGACPTKVQQCGGVDVPRQDCSARGGACVSLFRGALQPQCGFACGAGRNRLYGRFGHDRCVNGQLLVRSPQAEYDLAIVLGWGSGQGTADLVVQMPTGRVVTIPASSSAPFLWTDPAALGLVYPFSLLGGRYTYAVWGTTNDTVVSPPPGNYYVCAVPTGGAATVTVDVDGAAKGLGVTSYGPFTVTGRALRPYDSCRPGTPGYLMRYRWCAPGETCPAATACEGGRSCSFGSEVCVQPLGAAQQRCAVLCGSGPSATYCSSSNQEQCLPSGECGPLAVEEGFAAARHVGGALLLRASSTRRAALASSGQQH